MKAPNPRPVLLLSWCLVSFFGRPVRGGSLERLTDKLLRHKSYKVRLQAAAVLGRLGDPRALGALGLCVRFDESYLVRAMCVTAVGKIGVPEGRKIALAASKDRHPFVRKAAARALSRLADFGLPRGRRNWARPPRRHARMFVLLGTMNGRRGRVGKAYRHFMREAFWEKLARFRRLDLATLPDKPPVGYIKKYRLRGYRLDATVVRLRVRRRHRQVLVSVRVRLALSEYPRGKIVMMTTGKATASQRFAGGRASRKLYHRLKLRAIGAAVQSAVQNVWAFLKSH